tara:strand:- start:2066 stop:2914 length:849 start_codon:yes stop_codon:yes gene_type:complete
MHKKIDLKDLELKEIYNLMISGVSPRPIAFVGTQDELGNDNLAPFSYFNAFGSNPPIVGFSPANSGRTGKQKDTLLNIRSTREFSVSMINYDMVEQVSLSSCEFESDIDEFVKSGLTKKESSIIKPYSVNESYFIMECKLHSIIELGGKPGSGNLILGEIVSFHVSIDIFDLDNRIDPVKLDPISRLGYNYYSRSRDGFFQIHKPKHNGIGFDGLPELLRTSKEFSGNELAKLAGVSNLPSIDTNFDYLDNLTFDDLVLKVKESLLNMDLDISWQAALRLIK